MIYKGGLMEFFSDLSQTDHHFHNGVYEFTYSLMFMNNILICYKNIQVLEHVCVVHQYTFIGIYYKSIYE